MIKRKEDGSIRAVIIIINFKQSGVKSIKIKIMHNSPYPFNQKEHTFDFKVKVNFQNGNISLTAPQIVSVPAKFNEHHQPSSSPYYPPPLQQTPQQPPSSYNYSSFPPMQQLNNPRNKVAPNQLSNPSSFPSPTSQPFSHSNPYTPYPNHPLHSPTRVQQPIELVNSSYTSLKSQQPHNQHDYSSLLMNNSIEVIECVLCQKSFTATEFDQHLDMHKNRSNRTYISGSGQKGNNKDVSNFALTHDSFNCNGNDGQEQDSLMSLREKGNYSFQNQSYRSQMGGGSSSGQNPRSQGNFNLQQNNSNSIRNSKSNNNNNNNNINNNSNNNNNNTSNRFTQQPQQHNESSQLLGLIQNPILAINAAQHSNLSLSSSTTSHQQQHSLNYSNSHNQSTTRFPNQLTSIAQNSPNFNNNNVQNTSNSNPHNNSSSFGHQDFVGGNVIGPSFYQNSSREQEVRGICGGFGKGVNRLAYGEGNGSIDSNRQQGIEPYNTPMMAQIQPLTQPQLVPQVMSPPPQQPNDSYHSSRSAHLSNGSLSSYHSHGYIPQPQPLFTPFNLNSHPNIYQAQYSSPPNGWMNGSNSFHSYHSQGLASMAPPPPMMIGNMQTIESRYLNQPLPSSNSIHHQQQPYASQQDFSQFRNPSNNHPIPFRHPASHQPHHQDASLLFRENDISSISGSSRRDLSDYSDWSQFNSNDRHQSNNREANDDMGLQGYNSADNSLIKYMQGMDIKKKSEKMKVSVNKNNKNTMRGNNIYYHHDHSNKDQERLKTSNADFHKKKADHMIASTTSYYDRKFKAQDYMSSSSDQQPLTNTGRLSYAQRLQQKKETDNSRPVNLQKTKSQRLTSSNHSNLKKSSRSQNLSNCSGDSSLSKTKLPVNYLAREEFISTSSNSKSTHKTNVTGG